MNAGRTRTRLICVHITDQHTLDPVWSARDAIHSFHPTSPISLSLSLSLSPSRHATTSTTRTGLKQFYTDWCPEVSTVSRTKVQLNQPFHAHCCHTGTAIKHPVPDRVEPSFVIFDIWTLWRSALSVIVSRCQNYKWQLNPVWHGMLYSCTHMATVGVKGLTDTETYNNVYKNLVRCTSVWNR